MKFKALALALCAMNLAAQDLSELYAKASEYEARGDYKNAMIYYKKIAAASLADKGDKPRRKVAPKFSKKFYLVRRKPRFAR